MAFYDPQEDENQQDPNAQVPGVQTQSGSSVITGQGGGATGGGSQPAAAKPNAPDRPGNFVNLQDYLSANKTQAEKLGGQTSGVIQSSADQAKQGVSALNDEATQKVQGTPNLSSDVTNKIQNNAELLTPEERAQVKATQTATYQGPQQYTDLNSYQNAADATKKASDNVTDAGTEQGRMSLITQINNKPRTQGDNVFDNALLQSGSGRQQVAAAADANKNVGTDLDTATTAIQNNIGRADDPSTPNIDESAGAIGQTNQAQANAYQTVQDALNNWKNGFQPKVQQAQDDFTTKANALQTDIGDNPLQLSDNDMAALGLDRGTDLYQTNLANYLNPTGVSDISAANVATPEDYARYSALADLSGDTSGILDPANASKAGSLPALTMADKLKQDLATANSNYQGAYQGTQGGFLDASTMPADWDHNFGSWVNQLNQNGIATQGDINKATPQQIENYWLPLFKQQQNLPFAQVVSKSLEDSLNNWKSAQGANNVVNGYGIDGNLQDPTTFNGHIINRI